MQIKIKKKNKDGIVRLETSGDIKEFILKEDFLNPGNSPLLVCFKGKDSSGIIELSPKDIEKLYNELQERKSILKESKVLRFEK
jgi:hypothetical protein